MEYMACGLPVICSDSGGNRELVIDGENGFVIPSENVDSFVEKLVFLKIALIFHVRWAGQGRKE